MKNKKKKPTIKFDPKCLELSEEEKKRLQGIYDWEKASKKNFFWRF